MSARERLKITHFTYHIPNPQLDILRRISRKKGISVSEILRRVVDDYLEGRAQKRRSK